MDNLTALMDAVMREKPSGAKGQYIRSLTLDDARWAPASAWTFRPHASATAAAEPTYNYATAIEYVSAADSRSPQA